MDAETCRVAVAQSDAEISKCFPVMAELRPFLREADFVSRVRRQQAGSGYALAFCESQGRTLAVGGFRISECLAWGKFLYVDDLVAAETDRGRCFGGAILKWLVAHARANDCDQLHQRQRGAAIRRASVLSESRHGHHGASFCAEIERKNT